MNIDRESPTHEWAEKEEKRTTGYRAELAKSRSALSKPESEEELAKRAKQERVNKNAREALEKLQKMGKFGDPEQTNLFGK